MKQGPSKTPEPYSFTYILTEEARSIWALLRKRLRDTERSEIGWCIATLSLLAILIFMVVWYSINQ